MRRHAFLLIAALYCMAAPAMESVPNDWTFKTLAPELIHRNLLVLYSNDFVKADSVELINDVKAAGGTTIAEKYVVTDHSWSDHRITLASLVINWLGTLPGHL